MSHASKTLLRIILGRIRPVVKVIKVAMQVKQGAQVTEALSGWGIWHILSIKEHF